MEYERYTEQQAYWPTTGQHILAQFDADSIYVYQAYRHSIADYAIAHQRFGGEFSYSRMSWIKPNFLWMMFRCGWATKDGQERVLAIQLRRQFFDELLEAAVASTFDPARYESKEHWKERVADSEVRLQWDPDHTPQGRSVARRALQLGLRGMALSRFGEDSLLSISDLTPFVAEQRVHAFESHAELLVPRERVYSHSEAASRAVGASPFP